MKIDLNADLGEGCANDAALLQLVSSANIACGFHAGDAQTMLLSVREALKNGVAIGAHPSFSGSGRFRRVSAMTLPAQTVYAQTLYQIGALAAITQAEGGVMRHVKPHGMLYNQAAKILSWLMRLRKRFMPAIHRWFWWRRKRTDSCRRTLWPGNASGSFCRSGLSARWQSGAA